MVCDFPQGNSTINISSTNSRGAYGLLCANSTDLPITKNGESPGLRIFRLLCYTIVFIVGTIGNSLVVWLVAKRRLRARYNYFLANLAIADLAVVTINLPFRLAYQENDYEWPFGFALCKIIPPLTFTFTTASAAFLMAVSFERYHAVVNPLKLKVTRLQLKSAVIFIWILSVLVTLPLNWFMKVMKKRGKIVCTDLWPSLLFEQLYFSFLFVVQFAFPLVVMLLVYMRIICQMNNNQLRSCNHRASAHIRRRNKRVIRMLVVVVVAYFVCVMPYSTYLILAVFGIEYIAVKKFLVLLVLANSMMNPLLYGALNRQFRIGYMEAMSSIRRTCLRGKKQPTLKSIFKAVPDENAAYNQRKRKYVVKVMISRWGFGLSVTRSVSYLSLQLIMLLITFSAREAVFLRLKEPGRSLLHCW